MENAGYTLDVDKYAASHTTETTEIVSLKAKSGTELDFTGILSNRPNNIITAGLSLGRTLFVCVVLTLGALMFSKDGNIYSYIYFILIFNNFFYTANDLALRPIERMIDKVNKIARNPISAKE